MAIAASCPKCNGMFQLPEELAGKQVRCERCAEVFNVPMSLSMDAPLPAIVLEPPIEPAQPTPLPAPMPQSASPPAKTTDAPAPPAPASAGWAIAALVSFFLVMLGTGAIAAFWVAANLSPPTPNSLGAPVHVMVKDFRGDDFKDRRKDRKFRDDGRFDEIRKDDGPGVPATPLFIGPDGKAFVNSALAPAQPWNNLGNPDHDSPVRLFRVTLERERRYHFVVNANGFAPRIRIFDGQIMVAVREEPFLVRRCFLSYQAPQTGEYFIQVTRAAEQGVHFDLAFAPVAPSEPERIQLNGRQTFTAQGVLRVQDPLDLAAPATFGPYRDYLVAFEAGKDYEININNTNFQTVLRIYDSRGILHEPARGAQFNISHVHRAAATGDYRLRVTGDQKGMGPYALHVTAKAAGPIAKKVTRPGEEPQTMLVALDELEPYEDRRTFIDRDPLEPNGAGRGHYKAYVVPMVKGRNYVVDLERHDVAAGITLFDPAGERVTGILPRKDFKFDAILRYQATETGPYRLHVFAAARGTGEYTLRIHQVP